MWAGIGKLPQTSFVASNLQQKAPRIKVYDITEGNKMIKELKNMEQIIHFNKLEKGTERDRTRDIIRCLFQHRFGEGLRKNHNNKRTTYARGVN